MSFSSLIERFIKHLALERRLSIHTQINYQSDLQKAALFFQNQFQLLSFESVAETHIRAFLVYRRTQKNLLALCTDNCRRCEAYSIICAENRWSPITLRQI